MEVIKILIKGDSRMGCYIIFGGVAVSVHAIGRKVCTFKLGVGR
jgi:hypothetical protein